MRLPSRLSLFVAFGLTACGSDTSTQPQELSHDFPPVQISPEEGETEKWCQSWTLDNDEAIYVNAISMQNDGFFHHSNWFWVPEDVYAGEDGTWLCDERGYEQGAAAITGGVVFAQSTQATDETLGFAPNAAFKIPPRSRIVGGLHLVNPSEVTVETSLSFQIKPIKKEQAEILMSPAAFTYYSLAIPTGKKSRFQGTCNLEKDFGAPIDFSFYYMLPHYHALGTGTNLVAQMPNGPASVFGSEGQIGEPKSKKLDPPFSAAGSSTMTFSCDYFNNTGKEVGWGNAGGEMCILVTWTDSPYMILAAVSEAGTLKETVDGVEIYEGKCGSLFMKNDD
ncbi:MAG: hypothetical protein AB7O24_14050 [Kofleriaceae bacterium]